ncbi:MAG: fibronectin type III domain-containing protein [Flavobacterium sp.]|uniref:fibronectin type III domain-containing protein n=1 Tax=Flavobacterium sp. TaxID=239 RepID=UPI001B021E8F|nr:fibronectin type III domain-containing protein [Flavobacterium sp.]MBO9585418.1 fibronectin type III domain-containing protein [Flavobacterium sp.]
MLKKLHCQLFLTLGFWLSAMVSGIAQTYPVTISTQISQPSPIYLSNYADATTINSPIKVQISLNDLTISNRKIRLKCYFQGQSISLTTNDFVVGARDLYLEGGVPLQLTNVDLAPYFEYQNLLGINPNQYAQALPEGIYNFSVEVYDFATNKKLSKKTSVTTIIFQNDPPFLNLPLNNASIMQQNIQNIIFSWTPRQINVSNVEYEFSLVEIWDKYTPVQNAFLYSPPLYTTTTRATTLQYSVSEPQLLPGKRYAWRIKAKALQGAEEVGVFKNNGYSEIFSFDYETYCTAPLAITTTDISQDQAKITWSGDIDNFDYQVNYREKNANSDWYKIVTPREFATISNLKPNTTYEYTVGASCEVGKYTHSTIHEFSTMAKDEIAFVGCGIKPDPADLANKNPLPELFANDVVKAGDFPIVVLHATGSNGTFTGDGYVTLPFLEKFRALIDAANAAGGPDIGKYSRIRITFNNIGINTDFKLISGEIIASYDPNWKGMADGDQILTDILGSDGKPIEGKLDYVVKSATLNPDGSTTITGENGAVTTLPKSAYDQVYTDKNGTTVTIPANGSAAPTIGSPAPGGKATASNTNGMSSGGEVAQISSPDVRITFEDSKDSKYAFDPQPENGSAKLKSSYEVIPTGDGKIYKVNYKAVSDLNGDDYVIAKAEFSKGKKNSDIVFKTIAGGKVDAEWTSDNTAKIALKKTLNFGKDGIIATVKGTPVKSAQDTTKTVEGKYDIAGKLNVWHLTKKSAISVTLLSVNGATTPSVADAEKFLNEVYNKAGISFTVTNQNVKINTLPSEIECGNSDLLNVYTDRQIDIISQIESNADFKYNEKTYYVLYTGKSGQDGYDGFMPLGGQYAFVFNSGNLKTAAHELGHGIFGLKHPFSSKEESGKTNLLMDYGNGTVLSHNDWDIIHSGGWKFYGFQKSSSGADRQANELDLLGNIFKVTENEAASGNILVAQLSEKTPFLITGFNLHQTETKKLLATFIGKVSGNEVVYELSYRDNDYTRVRNIGDKMPYPITLKSNGDAVIKILNDQCSYSKKTIYAWKKPDNATTANVIEQVKKYLQKDNKFTTVALYSADPSCNVVNSLVDLINHDKNKCQPNIIEVDLKKLNTLFAKSSFSNPELVDLIVNQQVCISALRKVSWENLKKAFKQLSLSSEIKNDQEIAILRVMVAVDSKNVPDFYNLLSANNHEILISLNKKLHDHSINPYDNENYTSFYQGLMAMFSINNLDLDRLIPKDDSAAYNFIKNLVPESVTGFDESYYYEYVTNQTVSDKFKMIPVFWKSISNETRKNLIDLALNNNSMFDKSEEILLNLFIHVNDRYGITEELQKNNYSLLWSVYKVLDGKERKFFVQDIFYKTLVYNKIPNGYANKLALEVTNKYNTIPPLTEVRKEPYFMFYDQGIFNVVSNNGAVLEYHLLSTKSLSNPSRILFNCSYQVINSKDPKNPVQHLFDLAPYEYVVLEIPKDFTVDGREFKKGLLAVPAIYAYWMINAVEDHNDAILLRLVADGVAIALAPFTSGGSLLTLELTMVSADVLITATNYNNPGAISPKYNAIWDAVYAIYNLPKAVSGLTNLTRGVFQFAVKEGKYIETVQLMRSRIKNLVTDFQNLNETERLAHLNALDNLVETITTTVNGGTLNPDEIRVAKKMYDLVVEARIKCQNIDQSLSSIIDITVDNGTILLNNGITASPAVAEVTISKNSVNLSKINWFPDEVTNVPDYKIVGTFDNISYVDKTGQTINGTLNIIENLKNKGKFYAAPKLLGEAILVENVLAKYPNIRKNLGDSRTRRYLNNSEYIGDDILTKQLNITYFQNTIIKAQSEVLEYIEKMDRYDFAEMTRGYRDLVNAKKITTFENALKTTDDFYGKYNGWFTYWKLTPDLKASIKTIEDLSSKEKLLPTGNANDLQLAYVQAFTVKGDFINVPLRYEKQHFLGEFGQKGFDNIMQCLDEFRKVPKRLYKGEVFSGKTFSVDEFNSKFVGGTGKTIDYLSFVSSSLKKEVAEGFIELTAKHAGNDSAEKIAVIQRINTKKGVYIDDLSDWGINLGNSRHADEPSNIQVQYEVLMNPGSFRQMSEPIPIKNAQGEHIKISGYKAYYLDLIEL